MLQDCANLQSNRPKVIIGCIGRVYDLICRNKIDTHNLKTLVIDEADEMLSNTFKLQLYDFFQVIPENVQIALVSATTPIEFKDITKKFMRDPVDILVEPELLTLEGIKQYKYFIQGNKHEYLLNLFDNMTIGQCIIYCNSVNRVIELFSILQNNQYSITYIHGKMTKQERKQNFEEFKCGNSRILISRRVREMATLTNSSRVIAQEEAQAQTLQLGRTAQ